MNNTREKKVSRRREFRITSGSFMSPRIESFVQCGREKRVFLSSIPSTLFSPFEKILFARLANYYPPSLFFYTTDREEEEELLIHSLKKKVGESRLPWRPCKHIDTHGADGSKWRVRPPSALLGTFHPVSVLIFSKTDKGWWVNVLENVITLKKKTHLNFFLTPREKKCLKKKKL